MEAKKRNLLIFAVLVFAILCVAFALVFSHKKQKSKKLFVAFYQIPAEMQAALRTEILLKMPEDLVEFTLLDSAEKLPRNLKKKYSLLFTLNGCTVQELESSAKDIPSEFFSHLPTNIAATGTKNGRAFALPILLDHFEIDYYTSFQKNAHLEQPQNYADLLSYLAKVEKFAEYPLFCPGRNDDSLLDMVSVLCESLNGAEKYLNIAEKVKIQLNKDKTLAQELFPTLDELKRLQNAGLLHKHWYEGSIKDADFFMQEHLLGAQTMTLSTHRKKDLVYIKYYNSAVFPPDSDEPHGIIAPELCAIFLNSNGNPQEILSFLITPEVQEQLSDLTGLAPVSSQGIAHDSQADDVRYWAASTPKGPLPSLKTASCATPADRQILCTQIRDYLAN